MASRVLPKLLRPHDPLYVIEMIFFVGFAVGHGNLNQHVGTGEQRQEFVCAFALGVVAQGFKKVIEAAAEGIFAREVAEFGEVEVFDGLRVCAIFGGAGEDNVDEDYRAALFVEAGGAEAEGFDYSGICAGWYPCGALEGVEGLIE